MLYHQPALLRYAPDVDARFGIFPDDAKQLAADEKLLEEGVSAEDEADVDEGAPAEVEAAA